MDIYRQYYRPEVKCEQDPFFVTENGFKMESSGITSSLQSIWRKAGFKSNIGTTIIRKILVTETHSNNSKLKFDVAQHMKHSSITAEKSYLLSRQAEQSAETSKAISTMLMGGPLEDIIGIDNNNINIASSSTCATDSDIATSSTCATDCASTPEEDNADGAAATDLEMMVDPQQSSVFPLDELLAKKSPKQKAAGRYAFNEEERVEIKRIFSHLIAKETIPPLPTIRAILALPEYRNSLIANADPTKLRSSIHGIINKNAREKGKSASKTTSKKRKNK